MLGLAKVRASVSQLVRALYVSRLQDRTRQMDTRWGTTASLLSRVKGRPETCSAQMVFLHSLKGPGDIQVSSLVRVSADCMCTLRAHLLCVSVL